MHINVNKYIHRRHIQIPFIIFQNYLYIQIERKVEHGHEDYRYSLTI